MQEKIGNVTLDYEYYPGEDLYSDGPVEEELLEIAKNYQEKELNQLIYERNSWPVLYHFSHIRQNILEWLPITKEQKVLEIGSGCGPITGVLARKAKSVTCIDLSKMRSTINAYRNRECDNVKIMVGNFQDVESSLTEKYDYITLIGVFEYSQGYIGTAQPYVEMLRQLRKEIRKLKNLQLLETMQYDASKIVISARGRMSGKELQEILLENDHLQMEMAAGSYVIAMTGPGDTQEGMNRLLNALRNLDKRLDEVLQGNRKQDKNLDEVLSGNRKMDAATMKKDPGFCRHPLIPAERVVESAKVKGRKGLAVPWQEAAGKVSLEFVYLYPPGIPIVVPGERVSEEAVQQILDYEKNGFTIEGTKKKDRLEVLKNG